MARTPGSTATETPESETTGTRHRKGRRASARGRRKQIATGTGMKQTGTGSQGVILGDTGNQVWNTTVQCVNDIVAGVKSDQYEQVAQNVTQLVRSLISTQTSQTTTNTIPTETPLQGQSYAAGAR